MQRQLEIHDKMRAILVDWLIEVHQKFKLQRETLYITVALIDRYLAAQQCSKSELQLVGVTAMLIACKYEEIYPPELKDFVYITARAYTKEDVLQMEFRILSVLQFDVTFPTPLRFLERFQRLLSEDRETSLFAQYLLELALVDIRMLQYPSSVLAAAALSETARTLHRREPEALLRGLQGLVKPEDLDACCRELQFLHLGSMKSSLQAVRKKYQSSEFARIHSFVFAS